MKTELLQPTATIVAVLIKLNPVRADGPELTRAFVETYRALSAAQDQLLSEQAQTSVAPLRI